MRDDTGRIVDFTYLDVNRATCQILGAAARRSSPQLPSRHEPSMAESTSAAQETAAIPSSELIKRADTAGGAPLLLDDGEIKIMNLGVARFLDEDDADSLTLRYKEKVIGTAAFMAPEQREGRPASVRSACDSRALSSSERISRAFALPRLM